MEEFLPCFSCVWSSMHDREAAILLNQLTETKLYLILKFQPGKNKFVLTFKKVSSCTPQYEWCTEEEYVHCASKVQKFL